MGKLGRNHESYKFAGFLLIPHKQLLMNSDRPIALSPRAYDALVFMVRHRGELIDKATLMNAIWPDVVVEENNLHQHISALRRILGEGESDNRCIVTIPRRGYRFVAEVTVIEHGGSNEIVPGLEGGRISSTLSAKPKVAVLPLKSTSAGADTDFFCAGLHPEIIGAITASRAAVSVVPHATMTLYSHAADVVDSLTAELMVTHVLDISCGRERDRLRLVVLLIDAHSRQYIWSHVYERDLTSVLQLQVELANELATALLGRLVPGEPAAAAYVDPAAYDLYLKAKLPPTTHAYWSQAEELLSEALRLDPSFGLAYVTRAQIRHAMINVNLDASEARLQLAREDIDAAGRRLGSQSAQVLFLEAMQANLVSDDHHATIRALEAMRSGGSPAAFGGPEHAALLLFVGRLGEAIGTAKSLALSNPGDLEWLQTLPTMLAADHKPIEAFRVRELLMERFPQVGFLHLTQGRMIFEFTGTTTAWRTAFERDRSALNDILLLDMHWELLRFERRYADLKQVTDNFEIVSAPATPFASLWLLRVGRRPAAVFRAWTNLLNGLHADAAAEGRTVLQFVDSEPASPWNKWFLKTLQGEGLLLAGYARQAVEACDAAIQLMPRDRDVLRWRYAMAIAARVCAWAGAKEKAVRALQQLASSRPGLSPAEIARDPLYFIPLEDTDGYRNLVSTLEQEISRYRMEFGKIGAS